jgi:hypothetical protein
VGVLDALDSSERRFCVGRWLGMLALREDLPIEIDICEAEDEPRVRREKQAQAAFAAARKQIETTTEGALCDGREEEMDRFLERLATNVAGAGTSGWIAGHAAALSRRIATYLAAPEDPFDIIAQAALEHSIALYEQHGHGVHADRLRLELGVASKGKAAALSLLPAVGGGCRVNGARVVVCAKLKDDPFWRPEMCSLLYVFLHELIVHAFAAEQAIESPDGFAEGWMDAIAFGLHRDLTRPRMPPTAPFGADLPLAWQHHHAEQIHVNRAGGSVAIRDCKMAATSASNVLESRHGSSDAHAAMRAFSVALNTCEIEPTVRAEACEQLGRDLGHPDEQARTSAEEQWAELAVAVSATMDATDSMRLAEDFALRLAGVTS